VKCCQQFFDGKCSAKGAEYESQGQARGASPLVRETTYQPALNGRNIPALQALCRIASTEPGAMRFALALAFIFRAFGAALSSERGGEFAREDEAQGAA
jgi:hypothetical protein